jgi:hypothetical protein
MCSSGDGSMPKRMPHGCLDADAATAGVADLKMLLDHSPFGWRVFIIHIKCQQRTKRPALQEA